MKELMIIKRRDSFFERTIEEVLNKGFYNSLDSNFGETEDRYIIEVAVPGMSREDLVLHEKGGVLYLQGLKKKEKKDWWVRKHTEYSSTTVNRSFVLPNNTNLSSILARCKNGLLTIELEKIKTSTDKRIVEIKNDQETDKKLNIAQKAKKILLTLFEKR